ncbi:MAG: histidyl-tRNA synthetase [Gammaproteobacteria bacterium]|nr:histidyl-tRNA synthetase [Gammaproteobacteria bacterium]
MSGKIQAIRGMHDILPDQTPCWRHVEKIIIDVLNRYGYQEIRFPIVEKTELFARSIGELTDIVSKEMYTFVDRNNEQLTLRPEGTAGCVRAGLENGLLHNQIQKLWYIGPMFRHERPQKGRQRQFHQIWFEAFGLGGPDIDAEMIMMCTRMWQELELTNISLQLNTLGTLQTRNRYQKVLIEYFSSHRDRLDEDSKQRLQNNPLRILDSKNPAMRELIAAAPLIHDYLDAESEDHFVELKAMLDDVNIAYNINPHLVRGLDYYGKTVFEWITDRLGAQGTICAGGRYDMLVEYFGGKPTPAIGCAMGLERLIELLQVSGYTLDNDPPHVYFILADDTATRAGLKLAESLRKALPYLRLLMNCGGGNFKTQFKRADKSGALLAIVLGDDELKNQAVGIKSLRDESEQETVSWAGLADVLRQKLAGYLNLP